MAAPHERVAIINPASAGGRTARRWQAVMERMAELGAPCAAQLTEGPGHGIELARAAVRAGTREIVALGGDGTLGEVVGGCMREDGSGPLADDVVLGLVHQGTGGDLVRALGLSRDWEESVPVAAGGTPRRIDVGMASFVPDGGGEVVHRAYANCANVGISSEVVQRTTGRLKRLGNNGAFTMATVASIARNRDRRLRITLDGGEPQDLAVVDVIASNGTHMGGGMHVAPAAKLDDGQQQLCVISAAGRVKLLRTFPKIYDGSHVEDPLVRVHAFRTARLEPGTLPDGATARSEGLVLDGEPVGHVPATLTTLPGAISVRVPGGA